MQFFDTFLTCYGWEGIALAGAVLAMFGVQLYYYIFVYGRIPGYKNNRRPAVLEADPQVSVVIPLFSEDYSFVEERLPLILAQNYPRFRGGDRLRRPRFRFLRGARAAETVVPPNRDDQDSPRSPLSHLAQDGAQRGHQVGALRVHGLHFDRCRPPDRPLAGIDGQGLYAGRDRCGLLRRGAQERLCELHDARLAHDALRRLDRPCRTPKPLPGNAPQHRVYEEHLFRLQGVQPSQHEYRRGRPLHAEGHDAR